MSYQDYNLSKKIELYALDLDSDPFYALLMAAFRCADSENLERLVFSFPDQFAELRARRNAPGGVLDTDHPGVIRIVMSKWD